MPLFMTKDDVKRAIDDETEASTVALEAIARVEHDDIDPEVEAEDFKRQVDIPKTTHELYSLLISIAY